ncbi:MAG: penicillin acylase family protein [Deltaproteobacteria bacterium]|nr:penicillin acylase family protein [Deltaproteobacteria bacterium]
MRLRSGSGRWSEFVAGGLAVGVAGLLGLTGACGDDKPATDTVDADTVDTTDTDASDTGSDVDDADTADTSDTADTDTTTPEEAARAAILGVTESARFELPKLSRPVQVIRGTDSSPHIYAENLNDLGRVLGFIQARDRFFFMDLQRRLGLGTIAELLGQVGLGRDLESRGTGLTYVTDRMVDNLSPEFAAYLQAFADGVNDYIEAVRQGTLPAPTETQFAGVLGFQTPVDMMKPFGVRDVVSLAAVFMYSTNYETEDVGRTAALARLQTQFAGKTDEALRRDGFIADIWNDVRGLFPDTNSTEGFGAGKSARKHTPKASAARGQAEKTVPLDMVDRLRTKLRARELALGRDRDAGFGSNMWAVNGTKTEDGSALLANDGHLELSVPPLGYAAALDTRVFGGGNLHQLGGWLGNFPVMVGGTNGDVAWGGVNPAMDITDWYREEVKLDADGKPEATRFKGEWKPVVATEETFVVADVPVLDSIGHTERWTRYATFDGRWLTSIEGRPAADIDDHGAGESVVSMLGDLIVPKDVDNDGVVTAIAFDHVALDATKWPESLFEVGLAKNVAEVREATRGYVGAALFTSAADGDGSILYTSYQAVPCRTYLPRDEDGNFAAGADPTRLIDGTTYGGFTIPTDARGKVDEGPGQTDAQKCVVPVARMPYAIDPPSGFIFSANNDPAGLSDDGDEHNDEYQLGGPYASTRANTIRRDLQRFTADGKATIDDMIEGQANIQSRLAEVFVPFLETAIAKAKSAAAGSPLATLYAAHGARLDEALGRLTTWGTRGFHAASGVETFYATPTATDRDDAVATMIFNPFIRAFLASVWDDEGASAWRWGGEAKVAATVRFLEGRGPNNPKGLGSWREATGEAVFFDVLGTEAIETSDELLVKALVDALAFLEGASTGPGNGGFGTTDMSQWLWGLRHQVRFESILAGYIGDNPALSIITDQFAITTERLPLMSGLTGSDPRRDLKWFPRGGDQWSVDAANPGFGGDFTYGSGPAMRLVFKLKDGKVEGGYALPGGQSGLTDSPFFDDGVKLWLGNAYHPVRFTPAEVAAHALGREVYVPKPE